MVQGLTQSGQKALGGRATFEVELTASIQATASGKPRPFVALNRERAVGTTNGTEDTN
jgi:hypothetical protein